MPACQLCARTIRSPPGLGRPPRGCVLQRHLVADTTAAGTPFCAGAGRVAHTGIVTRFGYVTAIIAQLTDISAGSASSPPGEVVLTTAAEQRPAGAVRRPRRGSARRADAATPSHRTAQGGSRRNAEPQEMRPGAGVRDPRLRCRALPQAEGMVGISMPTRPRHPLDRGWRQHGQAVPGSGLQDRPAICRRRHPQPAARSRT